MSPTLFPFIAKINAPRALFTPQIRYGKPPPQARGLCAAVVRAGRGEQNPLLYNLAAGHYTDGGVPVEIKEFEPLAPFEPYESRMKNEALDDLLSQDSELEQSADQGSTEDKKESSPISSDVLDVDIDSILEGVRNGTISSVSPDITPALVYFVPQKPANKESSQENTSNEALGLDKTQANVLDQDLANELFNQASLATAQSTQAKDNALSSGEGALGLASGAAQGVDSTSGSSPSSSISSGAGSSAGAGATLGSGSGAGASMAASSGSGAGSAGLDALALGAKGHQGVRAQGNARNEYRAVLKNSTEETIIANKYIEKELKPLTSKVRQMAFSLIAFSGMEAIRAHLCSSKEEYLQQSNNGSKGIGLVIFDHVDPAYINHICTHIYIHQKRNLTKMFKDLGDTESLNNEHNSTMPSPFRTEKDKGLGRDFKRVQTFIKWINTVGEESYDAFDTVHLAIPRHTIKALDSANSNFYVDRINRAIHWRDHNNDTGQIVLSGVNSDDIQSSMEGVPSIKNDDLIAIMIENINNFFERNHENYELKPYKVLNNRDPLKTALTLLHNSNDFSFSLFDLATYAALCWIYYSEVEDMPQALGMAMPMLNLPREDNLFKSPSAKSASEKRYSNILANKAAYSLYLRSGYDLEGENLRTHTLLANLYKNFTWPGKDDSLYPFDKANSEALGFAKDSALDESKEDSSSEARSARGSKLPLVELNIYEICNIRNFLSVVHRDVNQERFDRAYNSLCFIEWQNKLQKLFIATTDNKAENKLLSERTREHIEKEVKNGAEPLSEEENEILPLCDKPNDIRSLQDISALIGFYNNRQFVIQTSASLNKAWEKILFAQESYEHENFLLSLSQALLYIMKHLESKQQLTKIVLDFPVSINDLTKINTHVLRSFSIYFGSTLKELIARSHGLLELKFANQDYLIKEDEVNPLYNFIAFNKDNKFKTCSSTSKAATILKLNLTPYYQDGSQGESLHLYWSLTPEHFAYRIFKDVSAFGLSDCFQCSTYHRADDQQGSAYSQLDICKFNSFKFIYQGKNPAVFGKSSNDANNLSKLMALVSDQALAELEQAIAKVKEHEHYSNQDLELDELNKCHEALLKVVGEINSLKQEYFACIYKLLDCSLTSKETSALVTKYSLLQNHLMSAPLSTNPITVHYAKNLLELLVMIGMAYEGASLSNDFNNYLDDDLDDEIATQSKYLTALATPLCVEGMHSLMRKNERLLNLMCSILEGKIKLNNQNLYIDHLNNEIGYTDNCEHLIRFDRSTNRYVSLISYQNYLGYTLYQNAQAYQERFNTLDSNDLSSSLFVSNKGLKASGNGTPNYNHVITHYQQDYLNEVGDYIEHYLKSRPYLMEQCTIMIYFCGVIDLIVAIYRYLEQNRAFSKVKFNLVIVNCTLQESKLIYQIFEQEKVQRSKGNIDGSFVQRIVVTVLTTDNRISAKSDSHFSHFLNQEKLSLNQEDEAQYSVLGSEQNLQELSRFADICLMFHVFDSNATCRFTTRNVNIPIVLKDEEYRPSLINFSNYQELLSADINNLGSRSFANNLGKYLVCPAMTVSRAQMQHALYYLVKDDLELFNKANHKLNTLIDRKLLSLGLKGSDSLSPNHDQGLDAIVPLLGVPLFELALSDSDNGHKQAISTTIKKVHSRSDVVIYFDDLMCRLVLTQNNIDLVYYHKLRNFALNFMVASNSCESQSTYQLQELLQLFKVTNDYQAACNKVRQDAISISGSLLLRAETKRIHVYEMMGLVLSKYLGNYILASLAQNFEGKGLLKTPTYVSLDDYCAIFGKKDQLRADILGLQLYERPQSDDKSKLQSRYVLAMVVLESKFFEKPNDKAASKSLSQTQISTQNFYNALLQRDDAVRGERRLWLSRIGDMLLTNANFAHHLEASNQNGSGPLLKISSNEFLRIQELLRNGQIDIVLKGVSLVYAHGHEDMTYSKAKSKGKVLGPGVCHEFINSQLSHSKDKYPVLQIKIYEQSLSHIMDMYLNDRATNTLDYIIERDQAHLIASYLQSIESLTKTPLTLSATKALPPHLATKQPKAAKAEAEQAVHTKAERAVQAKAEQAVPEQAKLIEQATPEPALELEPLANAIASTQAPTEPQSLAEPQTQAMAQDQASQAKVDPQEKIESQAMLEAQVASSETKDQEVDLAQDQEPSLEDKAQALDKLSHSHDLALEPEPESLDNAEPEAKVQQPTEPEAKVEQEPQAKLGEAEESEPEAVIEPLEEEEEEAYALEQDKQDAPSDTLDIASQDAIEPDLPKMALQDHDELGSEESEDLKSDDDLNELSLELKDDDIYASKGYSAMPTLDHSSSSMGELLHSSALKSSGPESQALSELDEFWQEHSHMHELVTSSSDVINFNNPKTLAFVRDAEEALLLGLTKQGLKPVLKDTKVTANGVIFSFEGNDKFETEMINKVRGKLLTTYGVDIYDVKPKSRQIDIYVMTEDQNRISIPFLALLSKREFNYDYYEVNGQKHRGYNTKIILGLGEETGNIVYLDYRNAAPHTLVAGSTGSGKSVLLNCLILDMALTNWPEELELFLVDPKRGVEFGPFAGLPHLANKDIIIEKDDAIDKLNELVEIMECRADMFTELTACIRAADTNSYMYIRDIDDYNKYCKAYGKERMKRLVFIMDEFADWFIDKQFKDNVIGCLQRLSQKGRYSGINVIFATQRPDSKLMDSSVKAQLGNRIALKTTDKTNSKIILDDTQLDASKLSGKGHMICKLSDVQYAQSGFIDSALVDKIIRAINLDYKLHKSKAN